VDRTGRELRGADPVPVATWRRHHALSDREPDLLVVAGIEDDLRCLCNHRRAHVNVDLFYGNFSRRRQALVDILTSVLFFLFLGVLLKESYLMAEESIEGFEVSYETTWRVWIWPSKSMIVVAAVLLLLQGIVKLIADIMIFIGMDVDESAFGPIVEDIDEKETL
jgi:hypothetical protein